LFICIITK